MANNATALAKVRGALRRRPKQGLTAQEISTLTGVNPNTVGVYLSALKGTGQARIVGQEASTGGRPRNRYAA
jgi:response regulator of citrate/malate metabolism